MRERSATWIILSSEQEKEVKRRRIKFTILQICLVRVLDTAVRFFDVSVQRTFCRWHPGTAVCWEVFRTFKHGFLRSRTV